MLYACAAALYRAVMFGGGLFCHQLPGRSPHLWNVQLPVCWRCGGIIVGAAALLLWLFVKKRLPPPAWSLALTSLMPLDVLAALAGVWDVGNTVRLGTGLLWGGFGTSVVLHLARRCSGGGGGGDAAPESTICSASQKC